MSSLWLTRKLGPLYMVRSRKSISDGECVCVNFKLGWN